MQHLAKKFSFALGLSALGLATISCDTTGKDDFTEEMSALRAVSANILISEDFEGSNSFSQVHRQFGTSHAFNVVGDPKDRSNHVGRFELRYSDPITSNGKRSEVLFPAQSGRDRWYSYSVMIPSNGYAKDSNREIISQWHQSTGGPPTIALKVANDKFFVRAGETADKRVDYPIADVEKDVWHDFVFHIVHSHKSDGLIEVWKNGKKVMEQRGANMYDIALPRWKVGIYKSTWAKNTTDTDRRVIMFDNVRLGNEKATLKEMTAGKNVTVATTATNTSTANTSTTSTSAASSSSENTSTTSSSNVKRRWSSRWGR